MALGIDSPARADRQDDKAHVRRENPILVSTRVSGNGKVSCKARSIGVVRSDVRRPSRVQRLDVDEQIGPRLVEISKNNIGGVVDGSSCTLHPLVNRALPPEAAAFGRHSRGAENSIKERDERLDGGIVSCGVKLEAMRAGHEMPVTRASQGFAAGMGHRGAGGAGGEVAPALGGRGKEKVECKCNREMLGICEGKEGCFAGVKGGNGEAPEPRERSTGVAAIEEAGPSSGGGVEIIVKRKESQGFNHCRGCAVRVWVAS